MCERSSARLDQTFRPKEPITPRSRSRSATRLRSMAGASKSLAIRKITPPARSYARDHRRGNLDRGGRQARRRAPADCPLKCNGRRDPYATCGPGFAQCVSAGDDWLVNRRALGGVAVRPRSAAAWAALGAAATGRLGAHGQPDRLEEVAVHDCDAAADCESLERCSRRAL